ncbi:MAG: MBL fold metallo-hydrolase [Bacteroidota bacterium]|nr:MBL fold metallo-hydrolase [Bacteroidota bacterium]
MNLFKLIRAFSQSDVKSRKPAIQIPVLKHSSNDFKQEASQKMKIMWLGHVGLLIEIGGKRILVDPVFSQRASPVSFAGPERFHENPLDLDDLPHINLVLISHNHYDHLDHQMVKQLKDEETQFISTLGLETTFSCWGVKPGWHHSLDWHERFSLGDLEIIATPSRHFSGRTPFDRNKTFWCSFVIRTKDESLFYEADSGYFNGFKEIGDQYGPFDATAMGIGAYNKLWANIHTFPEEALKAHQELRGKKMLPIHWCTFNLALHPWEEPIERTIKAAEENDIELLLPEVGEWIDTEKKYKNKWWR